MNLNYLTVSVLTGRWLWHVRKSHICIIVTSLISYPVLSAHIRWGRWGYTSSTLEWSFSSLHLIVVPNISLGMWNWHVDVLIPSGIVPLLRHGHGDAGVLSGVTLVPTFSQYFVGRRRWKRRWRWREIIVTSKIASNYVWHSKIFLILLLIRMIIWFFIKSFECSLEKEIVRLKFPIVSAVWLIISNSISTSLKIIYLYFLLISGICIFSPCIIGIIVNWLLLIDISLVKSIVKKLST